jgi:hypothetical protein
MTPDELCEWAEQQASYLQNRLTYRPSDHGIGYWQLSDPTELGPLNARAAGALEFLRRYAGPDSEWYRLARNSFENLGQRQSFESGVHAIGDVLRMWVEALQRGITVIQGGAVEGARRIATTEVMEQVRTLLADKGVHPAAPIVLAGAALETALRGAVAEAATDVPGKGSIASYAKALRGEDLITRQEMKDIEQMAGLRNSAAHGDFEEISRERAGMMEQQVNYLLSRLTERFDC